MNYIGLLNINFHQIQSFIAVVKYMNMTKAAESLHVTQPLISQKICSLEDEIGVQLFTRYKRKLQITPAGKYLYEKWSNIIQEIEDNVGKARKIQDNDKNSINIGFCFGIPVQDTVKIVKALHIAFPELIFNPKLIEIFNIRNELIDHKIDVAISSNYDLDSNIGSIQHTTIKECSISIVVSTTHELAKKNEIKWTDLKNYNIFCQPASQTGGYERSISSICKNYGFSPNFVQCDNIFSATANMELGNGVLVGVLSPLYESESNYKVFKMEDSRIPIVISYNADPNDELLSFINRSKVILEKFF